MRVRLLDGGDHAETDPENWRVVSYGKLLIHTHFLKTTPLKIRNSYAEEFYSTDNDDVITGSHPYWRHKTVAEWVDLLGYFKWFMVKRHAKIKQKYGIITKCRKRIPDTKTNKHHYSCKLVGSF